MYISLYLSIFLSTRCRPEYHDSSRLCVQNLLILKRFIPRSLHHEAFIAKPISDDSSQQKSKQLLVVINAKNNFTLKGVHENLTFQNWTAEEPSLIQNFLNTHFLRVSLRECRLQSDTFKSWRHTTNCRSYLKRTSLTGKILFDTCMLWHLRGRSLYRAVSYYNTTKEYFGHWTPGQTTRTFFLIQQARALRRVSRSYNT